MCKVIYRKPSLRQKSINHSYIFHTNSGTFSETPGVKMTLRLLVQSSLLSISQQMLRHLPFQQHISEMGWCEGKYKCNLRALRASSSLLLNPYQTTGGSIYLLKSVFFPLKWTPRLALLYLCTVGLFVCFYADTTLC